MVVLLAMIGGVSLVGTLSWMAWSLITLTRENKALREQLEAWRVARG